MHSILLPPRLPLLLLLVIISIVVIVIISVIAVVVYMMIIVMIMSIDTGLAEYQKEFVFANAPQQVA